MWMRRALRDADATHPPSAVAPDNVVASAVDAQV
jgi:hypothetical protein